MDSRRWRLANVLAVDDQVANLVALDAVLTPDFNLIRATSGEQAVEILQSRSDIDVILMDVHMPGMDGFEAATRVKQLPGCKDIPIIFITAVYKEDPFIKQGFQVGAVDYFTKPFDKEILRVKVGLYASFRQKVELLEAWERQVGASQALLDAGRRFSAMLWQQSMGIIAMDARGRIQLVSPPPTPMGLDWWDAAGYLREGRSTAIAHVIATGEPAAETAVVRGPNGTARTLLCAASALRERHGAFAGIVLVVRDITECDRLELDLDRLIAGMVSAAAPS